MPLARFTAIAGRPIGAEEQAEDRRVAVSPRITLSLSGFGEPLVHPEFLAFVQLARERGLRVEIITNGTLLDAALARELVALGVAQVTVSLDGGDEAAYAAIRGQAPAPAVAAVAALVEARRRARRRLGDRPGVRGHAAQHRQPAGIAGAGARSGDWTSCR